MAHIANVNGKDVFSDKRMAVITGSRVSFTDGSWCDVNTGQVHNTGSGYINIGTDSSSGSEKITRGPERVTASALELRGVSADVQVDVHDGPGLEYTITGPAEEVKGIRASVQGGTLVIESDGPSGGRGGVSISSGDMVIQTGRGRTVVSGGGVVIGSGTVMTSVFGRGRTTSIITGGGGENDTKITIKVPTTTPVSVNKVFGEVTIGDTNGPLTANMSTAGSLYAGEVTNAQLTASSSGSIRVKKVSGSVVAQASSSGDVNVDGGSMPSLMATASSAGQVHIGGTATTAMLNASSSGSVFASHVQQPPMTSESSSGSVRVGRIG